MSSDEAGLVRFGVSIPQDLLADFDDLIQGKGYGSRSEALRDLIRQTLVDNASQEAAGGRQAVGAVALVYDHHTREIADRLTDLAHEQRALVISSMHAHLSHSVCIEVLLLKGAGPDLRAFADRLISTRGVTHGKLVITNLVEPDAD
ncbi:MAG: nickel-responsive transcriptional regulator NikR [Candidatus Latescibacterota bacterium]